MYIKINCLFLKYINTIKCISQTSKTLSRFLSAYQKKFDVIPFCNLNVDVPFNVSVIPLDVHKYQNCDKVIIKLISNENLPKLLEYDYDKDKVNISCKQSQDIPEVSCNIEAPIKANINITTKIGNIDISNFHCDTIDLKSTSGNINASKCYCGKISFISSTGNIVCSNVIQAGEIYLKTGNHGTITTERLQGVKLTVKTENGDIKTNSSYCNDSLFATETGHLRLHNIHKCSNIKINKQGLLNLSGFDGTLHVNIKSGDADIQIARIENNSTIKIEETGSLLLKLFETSLENTELKLLSHSLKIDDKVTFNKRILDNYIILCSKTKVTKSVLIDCPQSNVLIKNSSLFELFNLKRPMQTK